jgi:hypothetical protein
MIATRAAIQYQVWYFVSGFIGIGAPRDGRTDRGGGKARAAEEMIV